MQNYNSFFRTGLLALLALPLLATHCADSDKGASGSKDDPSLTKVTFEEITEAIPNPERGFYSPREILFVNGVIPAKINTQTIATNRAQNRTILLTQYMLRDFIDRPISEEALALIRSNMQVLRDGGAKCILRFYYSNSMDEKDKPWDAEESIALQHIEQIKPILQEYADVIYVMQAGFVGVWGEWYYTDHFGFQPRTAADFLPRRHVVEALLKALPNTRQVALRTPEAKMKCFGYTAADSITSAKAFDKSDFSRVAGHNDCFLATENDMGTFSSKAERELWKADTRYSIMGGETCGTSSFCACANSLNDMAEYHWSYLNIAYHQGVIKGWKDNACFDDIECRLGYRLVLTEGAFTKAVKAGEPFKATIRLKNVGFAAPINPRGAELVFVSADGKQTFTQKLTDDPRHWQGGGEYTVTTTFDAPALTAGTTYTLSLNLPDPEPTLKDKPAFSIRTANNSTWDQKTGYNKLYTFIAE